MLAEGDSFPVQAFSYGGTAYALQFHMDVTHATMCRWTTRGHERMTLPNAKPRESAFRGPADARCRPAAPGSTSSSIIGSSPCEAPVRRERQPRPSQRRVSKLSTR